MTQSYAQPCDQHEYIESTCPDCGRIEAPVQDDDAEWQREFLLLASYCGHDNDTCTEKRPCADCLAMCNVFDESGKFLREFGANRLTPIAPVQDDDAEWQRERLAETQMLAHKWMEAHDCLKAGKPYSFPQPADLPDEVAALKHDLERSMARENELLNRPTADHSLVEALAVLDTHIQRCRDAVAECPKWSSAQAEWSRARDALLNYRDEVLAKQSADDRG